MANYVSELTVRLKDEISGRAGKASSALAKLSAAERALGALKNAHGAKRLADQLQALQKKSVAISEFRDLRRGLKSASQGMVAARSEVDRLKQALANTANPAKKMQAEMRNAQTALQRATSAFREQGSAVRAAEQALRSFGIAGRSGITQAQQAIRNELAKTIREMRKLERESRNPRPPPPRPPVPPRPRRNEHDDSAIGDAATVAVGGALSRGALGSVLGGAHLSASENAVRNVASESELKQARQVASQVSRASPYTTQDQALHDYLEGRSLAASDKPGEAVDIEKMKRNGMVMARARAALASSGYGLGTEDARNLFLALEGSGRANDPKGLENLMDAYVRAKQVLGTGISADKVRDFVANAKSSNFSMSDPSFFGTTMARLGQGNASRLGNEFSQTMTTLVGGKMTKQGAEWLAKQGLINENQIAKGGGGKFFIKGDVKGHDLLSTDPTGWAQQVLLPGLKSSGALDEDKIHARAAALKKADPKASDEVIEERAIHGLVADSLAKSGFRSTVTDNLAHAIGNEIITRRNVDMMNNARGLGAADTLAQNPVAALQEFSSSLENFGAVLTSPAMQSAGSALHGLAGGITSLTATLENLQKNNPIAAKALGIGAPAAAAGIGSYLTWKGTSSLFGRIFGTGGKGTAAGAGAGTAAGEGAASWLGRIGGGALRMAGGALTAITAANATLAHEDQALDTMSANTKQLRAKYGDKTLQEARDAYQPWWKRTSTLDASDDEDRVYVKKLLEARNAPVVEQPKVAYSSPLRDPSLHGEALTNVPSADAAKAKVDEVKTALNELNATTATPTISPAGMDGVIAKLREIKGLIDSINGGSIRAPTLGAKAVPAPMTVPAYGKGD